MLHNQDSNLLFLVHNEDSNLLHLVHNQDSNLLYLIHNQDCNLSRSELYQGRTLSSSELYLLQNILCSENFLIWIFFYLHTYIYIYYYLKKFCKSLTVAYASIVWVFGQNQGFRWLFKKFLTLIYVSVKSIIDEYFFFESIALKGLVWRIFIRVNKNQYWYFSVIWFYSFKIQFYN